MLKRFAVGFVSVSLFAACSGGSDDGSSQTAAKPTGELGAACDSNRDCAANLACHVDHDTHVADGQCATFCASNADCAKLGPRAKCIGAGICVATCAADVDCPAHTTCAEEGFCERTGPRSGKPSCTGTAIPCEALGPNECHLQAGCGDSTGCSAKSGYCETLVDQESCMLQQGCTWYVTNSCGGIASLSCSSSTNEVDCHQQPGCTWAPTCAGHVAEPDCSKISPTLCELTPGCELVSE